MVLILQSAAHEMQRRRLLGSWQRSLSRTRCTSEEPISLQTKEKGKFGRYLGTIYLTDDTSINAALVKERLAVPYFGQSKVRVQEAHLANRKLLKEMGWL
jgi:endonuclease YncB( thermonuclease family)